METNNKEKLQEHLDLLLERSKKCEDDCLLSLTNAILMVYSLLSNELN